jgi:hypothetical protein
MSMQRSLAVSLAVLITVTNLPLGAAQKRTVSWSQLPAVAGQKNIRIVLPDTTEVRGKVLGVEGDRLALQITRTSDKARHPKGSRVEIPRASVRTVAVPGSPGKWTAIGAAIGAGGGAAIAVPANEYAHNEGDGAPLVVALIVIVPAVLGLWAGWSADRKLVTYSVVD